MLEDNHDFGRKSEGYCSKCGNSLGIEGVCYICSLNEHDVAGMLERATTCPICGQRKTHYRLYGYRCSNPEHAEMEAEQRYNRMKRKG